MDPRPIGVFDSGIGGLMAVRMLRHLLPGEPILYLGDTARMPYGDRPAGEIDRLTGELTGWLLRQNVKALIAACGYNFQAFSPESGLITDVFHLPISQKAQSLFFSFHFLFFYVYISFQ